MIEGLRRRLTRWLLPNPAPLDGLIAAGHVVFGAHSYHDGCRVPWIGGSATVRVGNYCSIAEGATFLATGSHHPEWVTTSPIRWRLGLAGAFEDGHPWAADITVGSDVWVGRDALLLPGVTVGDGAVIGAQAVVTRDVGPYEIVGGVPARLIRRRFADDQIAALLRIRWWDWPDEKVAANVELLCSERIDEFIATHDSSAGLVK